PAAVEASPIQCGWPSCAAVSATASARSASSTLAPRSCRPLASAAPIPDAAPVTTAVRPSISIRFPLPSHTPLSALRDRSIVEPVLKFKYFSIHILLSSPARASLRRDPKEFHDHEVAHIDH